MSKGRRVRRTGLSLNLGSQPSLLCRRLIHRKSIGGRRRQWLSVEMGMMREVAESQQSETIYAMMGTPMVTRGKVVDGGMKDWE